MRLRIVATCAVIMLLAVACGNAGSGKATDTTAPLGSTGPTTTRNPSDLTKNVHVDAPGVTDTEIHVAAVTTNSNNPTGSYAPLADGVKAYFEMINSKGGIYGRKLKLTIDRDDQLGSNRQTVQASLSQDNAFATFIGTVFFTGADLLAAKNQPVFMWNINKEFNDHPTFFANDAALCFTCAGHAGPWLAKKLGATKVGVLAYGIADQSKDCAKGIHASFTKYPTAKVVYDDESLGFAQPLGPQVAQMKQKGVQLVLTCVDLQESFTLAKEMKKQGMNAVQQLPNGYDQNFIAKNGDLLEGSIVIPQFLAFEQTPQIQEIKDLFKWSDKIGVKVTELTAVGWQIASQLYTGLAGAGPEFSQAKVVGYLNTLTNYTDNGFLAPLDWTKGHIDPITHPEARSAEECANFVKVQGGKFVPVYTEPGKPWVCFKSSDPTVNNTTNKSFVGS
jgi:ABC-type branched-subunit amino acid transport system substrate-binding protein